MNKNHSIKKYLKDPQFIRWVNNPDDDISTYWELYAERYPECKQDMDKAALIIRSLRIEKIIPDDEFRKDVLNNIVARISDTSQDPVKSKKVSTGFFQLLLKSAAVFQILVVFGFSLHILLNSFAYESIEKVENKKVFSKQAPLGAKIQTQLPDGSSVWINSGSNIEYYYDQYSNNRIVQLNGEAFFDVVENPEQPFIVKTKGISVQALGTSFNVRAYEQKGTSEISLLTGKVALSTINGNSQIKLLPGDKAVIKDFESEFTRQKIEYYQDIAWKDGVLVFNKANFKSIKEELERWYGVSIVVSDHSLFKNWEVDAKFDNVSLEKILNHLSYTKEFKFKIVEKEIFLTKK